MKAKGQEVAGDLLKSACKSDLPSLLKAETNTIQWLHWLDILDRQSSNQGFGSLNLESDLDFKGNKQQEHSKSDSKPGKSSAIKESIDSSVKSGNMFGRGLQTSGDKYPALKFPEAMVAIAQAAKDLPGWPLMSNKMQIHKCEKCSQEFCSPLNLRRHMRAVHRRPLNGDKEDLKKRREQIAAFWDKLSFEDAIQIVSAKNLSLMDLSAAALVHALSAQLHQPSLLLPPQSYIKVATALLELIQGKSTKMPIKSSELFAILEDASEKNMFCGVISSSMHRCIFDNDPARVGLETKNVVASLGFLVEYNLVRAWMDDKDAEALRCQKALVEEEEAAQKRRAKLLERKKQRKMRLKECKDKEKRSMDSAGCLQELKFDVFPCEGEDSLTATQSSPSSNASSGLDSHSMETPQITNTEHEDLKFAEDSLEAGQTVKHPDNTEESFLRFSNQFNLQNADTLHDSVGARETGLSMGLSSNGMGWKERRQVDASYFQNHGRQLYGKDRKYYDHQYGGHRLARASYGVPPFDYFNPRYGHYRENLTNMKKQTAVLQAGHTVWARKTPQTSTTVSQEVENGSGETSEGRDGFIGVAPAGQSENIDEFYSAKSAKGLSRVSSLSSDSTTSQSSVSISAKVGAEEQASRENKTVIFNSINQTVLKDEVGGSAALVIGSMSIPLEHPLPVGNVKYGIEIGLKTEGTESLPDGTWHGTYEQVEVPQPASSFDDALNLRGGGFHNSISREDSSAIMKHVGPGVQNKSIVKVWRPVTPGDRSGSHFGGPSVVEGERSIAADTVCEQREETDISARSYHSYLQGSLSGSDVNILNKERMADGAACQGPRTGDGGQQPPDPSSAAYFSELLSFLSQRWSKAISSPDIVCHIGLDDADSDGSD